MGERRGLIPFFRAREAEISGRPYLVWPSESKRRPNDIIIEYDLPSEVDQALSENHRRVLDNLVRAASGFASVFAAQEGANPQPIFYPAGLSREDIIKASEENPELQIRSPYTIMEVDNEGQLSTKPMHIAFAKFIKENKVREHLREAAELSAKGEDKMLALNVFLRAREKAFETGDYKSSEHFWITLDEEPKISIDIGFHDTYTDQLMGEKYGAQAWVDIYDEDKTEQAKSHVSDYQKWGRQKTHRATPIVKVRAAYPKVITGQAALYEWSANTYPCQEEWRQEMGSKIHIFLTSFEKNVQRKIPIIKQLGRLYDVSDQYLKDIVFRGLVYHETAHSEVPTGIKERLGRLAQPIKELYCDLMALEAINDISTERHVKDMALMAVFAEGLLGYVDYVAQRKRAAYYVGRSTILSFPVEQSSVAVSEHGIFWKDTDGVFENLSQLLKKVRAIQSHGTIESAQRFFDSHFHPDIYSALVPLANTSPDFLSRESNTPSITL